MSKKQDLIQSVSNLRIDIRNSLGKRKNLELIIEKLQELSEDDCKKIHDDFLHTIDQAATSADEVDSAINQMLEKLK